LIPKDDFSAFYAEWFPRAVALARRIVRVDPEAAAQEVMIVFLTKDYQGRWDSTRGGAGCSFDRWVYTMLRHRLFSIRRAQSRRSRLLNELPAPPEMLEQRMTHDHDALEMVEFKATAMAVSRRLRAGYGREYSDLWRELIWLVIKEGRPGAMKDYLARRLGVSPRTVVTRLGDLKTFLVNDPDLTVGLDLDRASLSALVSG
jgi:DNA-directed RNA polymerase specialized sigma24 family protein